MVTQLQQRVKHQQQVVEATQQQKKMKVTHQQQVAQETQQLQQLKERVMQMQTVLVLLAVALVTVRKGQLLQTAAVTAAATLEVTLPQRTQLKGTKAKQQQTQQRRKQRQMLQMSRHSLQMSRDARLPSHPQTQMPPLQTSAWVHLALRLASQITQQQQQQHRLLPRCTICGLAGASNWANLSQTCQQLLHRQHPL
jgi:hypothetical protein